MKLKTKYLFVVVVVVVICNRVFRICLLYNLPIILSRSFVFHENKQEKKCESYIEVIKNRFIFRNVKTVVKNTSAVGEMRVQILNQYENNVTK